MNFAKIYNLMEINNFILTFYIINREVNYTSESYILKHNRKVKLIIKSKLKFEYFIKFYYDEIHIYYSNTFYHYLNL